MFNLFLVKEMGNVLFAGAMITGLEIVHMEIAEVVYP